MGVRFYHVLATVFTASILWLAGCAPKTEHQSVEPPKEIKKSFVVNGPSASSADFTTDKFLIGLRKTSLEKEFLLRTQMTALLPAPSFQGMRSRIIAFRHHGDHLLMLEASTGHVVDRDNKPDLLLAKFKVIKETEDLVYFDFNEGFADNYVAGDWYASDFEGRYVGEGSFTTVPLSSSYIEKADFDQKNHLIVNQVGKIKLPGERGAVQNLPIRMQFYLTTYQPDPTFQPAPSYSDFSQFGFFEVAPQYNEKGFQQIYYSKFNSAKPIVFAISANTPADFKETVREGILYWNKAFGRDLIQVVEAPDNVSAPNSEYNMVQWIDWDWAGGAYADAQMDPRTGQILNAQIFMTSAFAISGKKNARKFIREAAGLKNRAIPAIGLKGFMGSTLCHGQDPTKLAESLSQVLAMDNITDQDVLRVAQAYVREVVAHEVGHTLGLRHNFAGSLHASYEPETRVDHMRDLLKKGTVDPNLIPSSSVMEYSDFIDGSLSGHQLKHRPVAMPYDEKAIRHLYDGASYSRNEVPAYCGDLGMRTYLDCMIWDSGASTLKSNFVLGQYTLDHLPERILNVFIDAKNPVAGEAEVPVERVPIPSEVFTNVILVPKMAFLLAMQKDQRFLTVERDFSVVDEVNQDAVRAKKTEYVENQIRALGGLKAIFPAWDEAALRTKLERLDQVLGSGQIDKGVDEYGHGYQFSSTEMAVIKTRTTEALTDILRRLPIAELKMLSEWKAEMANSKLNDEYALLLKDKVEDVLFATTGQSITGQVKLKDGRLVEVHLPVFKYTGEERRLAFKALARDKAPTVAWAYAERLAVQKRFEKLFEDGIIKNWRDVLSTSMNREVLAWFLDNADILQEMARLYNVINDPEIEKPAKKKKK